MKEDITYICKLSSKLTEREKEDFLNVFNEVLVLTMIWIGLGGSTWTISMETPIWFWLIKGIRL